MSLKVRDLMSTSYETLTPESTMEEAVFLGTRLKIRQIPVVESGRLVGIVTDRDIKRASPSVLSGAGQEEYERVLKSTLISQIMTRDPVTIAPDALIQEAIRLLCERKFGAIPVIEGGALIGIITQFDLLRAFLIVLER
jgi:acetoin utilization protein AcuB